MEITEVKVKVVPRGNNKLKAFATITFDNAFVVKDIRVIQGLKGMIIAMPAKKLTFRCFKCGCKNTMRARFCNECGGRVRPGQPRRNPTTGRPVHQVDIAHPINPEARKMIEEKIIQAYQSEFDKIREGIAQQVGEPVGDDEFEEYEEAEMDVARPSPSPAPPADPQVPPAPPAP